MPSASQNEDVEMGNAASPDHGTHGAVEQGESGPQDRFMNDTSLRIRVLPGDSPTAASFEFLHEDHTLGNALRWIIMKNPDVEFCGYSIPHPSDPKMNLRIQTYDDVNVMDVLEKGLQDLMDVCDVITDKFDAAQDAYGQGS